MKHPAYLLFKTDFSTYIHEKFALSSRYTHTNVIFRCNLRHDGRQKESKNVDNIPVRKFISPTYGAEYKFHAVFPVSSSCCAHKAI